MNGFGDRIKTKTNLSVVSLLEIFLDSNLDDGVNIMISAIIRFQLFDVFDLQKLRLRLSMAGILDLIDTLRSLQVGQQPDFKLISTHVSCALEFLSKPQKCFTVLVYYALRALSEGCDHGQLKSIRNFILSDSIPKGNIFPFYVELQQLLSQLELRLESDYFSQHWCALFFQFSRRGRLTDFLLLFVSSIVDKHENTIHASSFNRACELSLQRLIWLCSQSDSVFSSCLDTPRETEHCWTSLLENLDAAFQPTSYSEWIFHLYHGCITQASSESFVALDALLPVVLSDPVCIEPVLPLIMAYCAISCPDFTLSVKASILRLCNCPNIDESFMVKFIISCFSNFYV